MIDLLLGLAEVGAAFVALVALVAVIGKIAGYFSKYKHIK